MWGLAKEPFFQFLLLGCLIFIAYFWIERLQGEASTESGERIVVDQQQLDHLTNLWELQWKRKPSTDDLQAILDRHLRQEVFYREALRLGLDNNDEIIRKRLAQKMEAVADDLAALMQPPTDEELQAFFSANENLFRLPRGFAFQQVLFLANEENRESTMQNLRDLLNAGDDIPPARMNKLSLANDWQMTPVSEIENAFGGEFATALAELPIDQWSGPIRSGFGWHLVNIREKQEAQLPPFEEVRDYVAREYEYQSELTAQDRVFRELLGKYDVRVTAENVPDRIRSSYESK